MEFIAKLKAEIKAEVLAELRAELVAELRDEIVPKAEPAAPAKPKAAKALKFEDEPVTFSKAADWSKLEADDVSYEVFEAWYEANSDGQYNHMRHAFNSLIKNERYIKISNDGTLRTYLQTWRA